MEERIGQCIYCGQNIQVRVPEGSTKEEINREAVRLCNCYEAQCQQAIETNINVTEKYIESEFQEENVVRNLLLAAVEPVGRGYIDKIVLHEGRNKYTMSRTSKKTIKVEKNTTIKKVKES
ncbi:MAG: hypothetical protein IJN92_09450 [Lachnospiraceae bacterium]|nr:hypothetical protein [Lachnospiraceae bacterium]